MQDYLEAVGHFPTAHAGKYMTQLCKHFGHKVPAEVHGNEGKITFGMGRAHLLADDGRLTITLAGSAEEALNQMKAIIDSHLQRFAFREEFSGMDWGNPDASRAG
ncbi:DUF2218 domain-containing protein [Paracoccus marinaquae]|uniref:DUF2218 domain-containing protein n=1 Tax=Paracoccus marinaquae TaxID=2841926 RepID=A0ABS6AK53_9RHOB|nr:DUF2218 domain-containing protein [Paracoccus marinaquae]MBU3030959.1 DUF2218 domain-containing protein [Paracoccus marinaquae]